MNHQQPFLGRSTLIGILFCILYLLPCTAAALDGTFGISVPRASPVHAQEYLEPGWAISATCSFSLTKRLFLSIDGTFIEQNIVESSAIWRSGGIDVGLEYKLSGSEGFRPFFMGGIGFRNVVKLEYLSIPTGTYERERLYYDEEGNLIEVRVDKVTEYSYYEQYHTQEARKFVSIFQIGAEFPFKFIDEEVFAPYIALRYVWYPQKIHKTNFSSISLILGLKFMF